MTLVLDLRPSPLLTDYMGTECIDEEEFSTFKLRLGQCYFLAGQAVVNGDLAGATLVHGTIHGRGQYKGVPHVRIGHAWVRMSRELVWEPITGDVYDGDEWYAYARAREERLYDEMQARIQMLQHQHWGRWHESLYP